MLALFAALMIILWALEVFAFHVADTFIHIALVVGVVLAALHLFARDEINSW